MLYENQRWWFMQGYTTNLFKLERGPWSDLTGEMALEKKDVKLLGKDWRWDGEWVVQGRDVLRQTTDDGSVVFVPNPHAAQGMSQDADGFYDADGWQYSDKFQGTFIGREENGHWVRRRKWVRVQVKNGSMNATPARKDSTTEPAIHIPFKPHPVLKRARSNSVDPGSSRHRTV